MKYLLILFITFFSFNSFNAYAQTGKVKKEKTEKNGIAVKGGMASYSIGNAWDCESGAFGEIYWSYSGLMKPRKPECHWAWEAGLGLDFYTGKATEANKHNRYDTPEDILMIGLFTIPMNAKYILNPLSTRGKWIAKIGADVCLLEIGVPSEDTGSTMYRDYRHLESTLGTKFAADAQFGYEAKHWGLFVGGFAGAMAPYSGESSTTTCMYGYYASFQYYF